LRADGSGANLLKIANVGSTFPHKDKAAVAQQPGCVQMNGKPIYEFAVKALPEAVITTAAQAGVAVEAIDYLIPHQANSRIINAAAERLGLDRRKIISNLDEVGNTSAASIPLALWQALKQKQMNLPAICALVGFGAGLTWGAAIVRWAARDKREM
jgi:3-oxoacyl-[acyl-carrier-protein] synthase III